MDSSGPPTAVVGVQLILITPSWKGFLESRFLHAALGKPLETQQREVQRVASTHRSHTLERDTVNYEVMGHFGVLVIEAVFPSLINVAHIHTRLEFKNNRCFASVKKKTMEENMSKVLISSPTCMATQFK